MLRAPTYARRPGFESLEPRQLLASTPLTVVSATTVGGLQLQIHSGNHSDSISVAATPGGLRVTKGAWSTTVTGDFQSIHIRGGKGNDHVAVDPAITIPVSIWGGLGDDTLIGGGGADKLYGQFGTDTLVGGAGDDTLVTIGDSRSDRLTGGDGLDSFWADDAITEKVTDVSGEEIMHSAVDRVTRFFGFTKLRKGAERAARAGLDLLGEDLPDPGVDDASVTYRSFANRPLFAAGGPSPDDVEQGAVGDCWFLATIASMAKTDADAIRRSVVELGDGTFAVRFNDYSGRPTYVRVDGELPVTSWGALQYAALGEGGSLWVAVMEKAYACYRYGGLANYLDLDGGWMSEAFDALGHQSDAIWEAADGQDLLAKIEDELRQDKAVTLAVFEPARYSPLVGAHAYTVDRVETDADGNRTLILRNPWGIDGAGQDGSDDGYVRVTAEQAYASFWGVISADLG